MGKITIIMPAYNSERQIAQSIQSVLEQTYTNIELIVINDGSQDKTESIVKNLMNIDNRIKYYKINNSGSAVARNVGLDNATGDYIAFVDSDDCIEPDMMEELVLYAKNDTSDIVSCSFKKILNKKLILEKTYLREGYYDKDALKKEIYPYLFTDITTNIKMPTTMWTKLFNREMIERNKIRFIPELRAGQDTIFTIDCLLKADSFYYLPEKKMYNYIHNKMSRTNTYMENGWNIYKCYAYQLKLLSDEHPNYSLDQQIPYVFLQRSKMALINVILNEKESKKYKLQEINEIITDPVLQEAISSVDTHALSFKDTIFIKLLKNKKIHSLYFITQVFNKLVS